MAGWNARPTSNQPFELGACIMRFFACGASLAVCCVLALLLGADSPEQPKDVTLQNVKIQGSLDLDTGVPIRWKKPDGSGYVNVASLDKDGTLRLCDDPYYYDAPKTDDRGNRVVEIRNPNSKYADFRLPITRTSNINADSKLTLRSMSLIETNDPSELNLVRTGDDAEHGPKNENAPIQDGSVTGLIRWMGRLGERSKPNAPTDLVTATEVICRLFGTSKNDAYGAVVFQVSDARYPQIKGSPLLVMKPGVRVGAVQGRGGAMTGGMLEVDSVDDRPVIFRRPNASTTQPVTLALAAGKEGAAADAENTLGLIKAISVATADGQPARSRVEIQTNRGKKLASDWVLPVPAVQVSRTSVEHIPSGELVALAFDREVFDNDGMHDGSKATRLTCHTPGRYAVSAFVECAANGKGSRQVVIRRNGKDEIGAMRIPAVDGETTQITVTAPPVELKADDYVELLVRQTSGLPLEIPANGSPAVSFGMTRAG
jgi:hypothetical protein